MKTRYSLIALGALMALSQAAMAQRGSSGNVNVIYWQAPSILNPYLSGGTKDLEASSLVLDPLVKFNQNGEMVAALVESVPTVANGGFSADFKTITYKLKRGLKWSDGSPLTASDVVFTYDYLKKFPALDFNSVSKLMESVEKVDEHTVRFNLIQPNSLVATTIVAGRVVHDTR